MRQGESDVESIGVDESIDAFVTRLRKKASRCAFDDKDKEIRYQIMLTQIWVAFSPKCMALRGGGGLANNYF